MSAEISDILLKGCCVLHFWQKKSQKKIY